jgi:hypothetical protein
MFGVGWLGSYDQAEKDKSRCQDIPGGFNSVGHGGGRVGIETNRNFRGREPSANQHAGGGDPAAGELACHLRLFLMWTNW